MTHITRSGDRAGGTSTTMLPLVTGTAIEDRGVATSIGRHQPPSGLWAAQYLLPAVDR
jgi:hypothetical protein